MYQINKNYANINESYLFADIASRFSAFTKAHPDKKVIKMSIGDVTLPLCKAVTDAMTEAVAEMGRKETFKGYGPEQGYDFLREAVKSYYARRDVNLDVDEIFISDGAKSDLGNILDIFSTDNSVLITDPVYPVYVDTNIMDGRKISFLKADESNGFLPMPDDSLEADIIYLCSPNNPTGAAYNKEQLSSWVDFAKSKGAVILFDSAYEFFVNDETLPRSIYEIDGARECAIEFCSLSKTAGFTGTRCGYTVVPKDITQDGMSLNKMWLRRQTTKFNGVPYIIQKGAAAVFSEEGQEQIKKNIEYYRENARIITKTFDELGISYTGGKNSPYVWFKCPGGMKSWEFFDYLLNNAYVIGTPGIGFGSCGEGFFRLTAFSDRENTLEAMKRISELFSK